MMHPIDPDTLESLIGTEIGRSDWIEVSQKMIDDFAAVTSDHQFIHVDPVRARAETPFGGTIAHGFLTLSLMAPMIEQLRPIAGVEVSLNYGCDRLRFLAPVPSGSRIRGVFVLASVERKPGGRVLIGHDFTIEIEGSPTPALVARWLGMKVFAGPGRR